MTTVLLLAGLLAAGIGVLSVPFDLTLRLAHDGGWRGRGRVRWMFGLLDTPVGSGRKRVAAGGKAGGEEKKKEKRREKEKAGAKEARRVRRPVRRAWALLRSPGFPARVLRFLDHLRRAVHVRSFDLDARVGLGDPADTGRLWGLLGPLPYALPVPPGGRVSLEPDFHRPRFELELDVELRVVPATFLARTLQLLVAPAVVRALFSAARA